MMVIPEKTLCAPSIYLCHIFQLNNKINLILFRDMLSDDISCSVEIFLIVMKYIYFTHFNPEVQ